MPDPATYYMMMCSGDDLAQLRKFRTVCKQGWFSGRRMEEDIPVPMTTKVMEGDTYLELREFYSVQMLMRDDLLKCIQEAGVDNLEVFDAVIRNEDYEVDYTNYKVINIVGVVSCADPDGTVYWDENPSRVIDANIDSLKIDESKAGGLLMFRLAEVITGIVVHERVKLAVEGAGFENMQFLDPADWEN